ACLAKRCAGADNRSLLNRERRVADGKKIKKGKSRDAKPKGAKKNKAKANIDSGVEALTRLVDHPLVTDLLAVGAMAAVAAIAEAGVQSKAGAAKGDSSRK